MSEIFTENLQYENGVAFRQEELENYYIDYIEAPDKTRLVITFDGSGLDEDHATWQRYPWGGMFIHGQGLSVIGIKIKQPDWYRDPALHQFFMGEAFQAIVKRYEHVYLYGNSMGGYAALAFAGAIEGAKVLALSPQSTLDPRIITWDRRFPEGSVQNWDGLFADAAKTLDKADAAYVVYDPLFPTDTAHIQRLPQEKIVHLKVPCLLHDVATKLSDMDLLKSLFLHFIEGDLEDWFPKIIRARKTHPEYEYTALFVWAMYAYKKHKYDRAERTLEDMLRRFPGNETTEFLLQAVTQRLDIEWGVNKPADE